MMLCCYILLWLSGLFCWMVLCGMGVLLSLLFFDVMKFVFVNVFIVREVKWFVGVSFVFGLYNFNLVLKINGRDYELFWYFVDMDDLWDDLMIVLGILYLGVIGGYFVEGSIFFVCLNDCGVVLWNIILLD